MSRLKREKLYRPDGEEVDALTGLSPVKMPDDYVSVFMPYQQLINALDPISSTILYNCYLNNLVLKSGNKITISNEEAMRLTGYKIDTFKKARAKLAKCRIIIKYNGSWYVNPSVAFKGSKDEWYATNDMLGRARPCIGMMDLRKEVREAFTEGLDKPFE